MSTLLALPTEVLLKIIDETCPDGIEELVSCCKVLCTVAKEIFKQHVADKQKYSRKTLYWPCRHFPYSDQAGWMFLVDILLRPRLAYYVEKLIVTQDQEAQTEEAFGNPFSHPAITTKDNVWREFFAVDGCPYVTVPERGHWKTMLEDGNSAVVLCLLLPLLPRLKSLWIMSHA